MSSNKEEFKPELGALRSPDDFRDHIAESIMARQRSTFGIPATLDLRKGLPTVRNQGSQGTCAAQTASCIREWQERNEFGYEDYLSPQFVYNLRSNYPGAGMYGRNVMEILLKNGICREQTYKYGTIQAPAEVPQPARDEADGHVIKEYARVTTLEGAKQCVYDNGPCYISFPVYNYDGRFWKQNDGNKYLGGHAVTIVGYNKDGFIIRNSWGTGWNGDGYTVYPYNDWGAHWEIWTTIDADTPDEDEYSNDDDDKKPNDCGGCVLI